MRTRPPKRRELYFLRAIADYQFGGPPAGEALFPDGITVSVSPNTLRIRHIYLGGRRIATLRAQDGFFTLSIEGAMLLHKALPGPRLRVYVADNVADYIARGGNVFAKHVIRVDEYVRPGDEVLVVDSNDMLLAVGKARMSAFEMRSFNYGEAVRVREGVGGRGEAEDQDSALTRF